MTTLPNEPVQTQQFAPTLNPQFRGAEPAALLHAAGSWLEAHPDVAVVALNLTNFDLTTPANSMNAGMSPTSRNAIDDGAEHHGWFVSHFIDPTAGLRALA